MVRPPDVARHEHPRPRRRQTGVLTGGTGSWPGRSLVPPASTQPLYRRLTKPDRDRRGRGTDRRRIGRARGPVRRRERAGLGETGRHVRVDRGLRRRRNRPVDVTPTPIRVVLTPGERGSPADVGSESYGRGRAGERTVWVERGLDPHGPSDGRTPGAPASRIGERHSSAPRPTSRPPEKGRRGDRTDPGEKRRPRRTACDRSDRVCPGNPKPCAVPRRDQLRVRSPTCRRSTPAMRSNRSMGRLRRSGPSPLAETVRPSRNACFIISQGG